MTYNKEYHKQYYIKNRTKILNRSKEWTKDNPEKVKNYLKTYYKNNCEEIKERARRWDEDNPEKVKEQKKRWAENNPEKVKEASKKWAKDNPEKVKESQRNRCKKNPEYHKKYMKYRRRTDSKFNLNHRTSGEIYKSLKGNKKYRKWEDLVGYSLNDLIKRLKFTMPKGYSWNDYLQGRLHVDHIIPISAHNFNKPEHSDFKRCWALSNLRLLPAKENLIKHSKLSRPFQPALKI